MLYATRAHPYNASFAYNTLHSAWQMALHGSRWSHSLVMWLEYNNLKYTHLRYIFIPLLYIQYTSVAAVIYRYFLYVASNMHHSLGACTEFSYIMHRSSVPFCLFDFTHTCTRSLMCSCALELPHQRKKNVETIFARKITMINETPQASWNLAFLSSTLLLTNYVSCEITKKINKLKCENISLIILLTH